MLKVAHVKKSFKKLAVLKDISLETQAGELVHISGVNGCGKVHPVQNHRQPLKS